MQRTASFIAFGVGLVMLILGLTGIAPGLSSGGGMLILFGVVLFGLSFVPLPDNVSDDKPMSPLESLTKIFYSPAEVFQNLRRHPRWFAALVLMTVLSSAYLFAFTARIGADKIVDSVVSKTVKTAEDWGAQMPSEEVAKMKRQQTDDLTNPVAKLGGIVSGFAGSFLACAVLAAIYLLIVLAMGGSINFWQAFAAVIYSSFPVTIIRYLLNFVILYIKDVDEIHPLIGQQTLVMDNLGVLVDAKNGAVLWVLLSSISVLSFYHLWMTATGLKNTGERVTASAAWSAAIIFWVVGLVVLLLAAALFPSFFS